MKNKIYYDLVDVLEAHRPVIWWRDDDVAHINWWHPCDRILHYQRLGSMLALLSAYKIPSFLAVIPYKFLSHAWPMVKLLDRYPDIHLAVHGLRHRSNSYADFKNEFPLSHANEIVADSIMAAYYQLKDHFGARVLPVFVPPYNTMHPDLASLLKSRGLTISAASSKDEHDSCHTDYDFVDWSRRTVKPHEQILADLTALIASKRKSIGINGHHKILTRHDRSFFAMLFSLINKFPTMSWPFAKFVGK